MIPETIFQRIVRKTGLKPVECKCQLCKLQCKTPCLGTPEDMIAIAQAGYSDRLTIDNRQMIVYPKYDKDKGACTFFTNGLCELHDQGLKPTVGKLSIHTITGNTPRNKLPSTYVIREWAALSWQQFVLICDKIKT